MSPYTSWELTTTLSSARPATEQVVVFDLKPIAGYPALSERVCGYPAAVNHQRMCAKFGNRFVKWFCTGHGGSRAYRALSTTLQTLVRFAGAQLIEEQSGEGLPRYRLLVNPMSAPWTSGRS